MNIGKFEIDRRARTKYEGVIDIAKILTTREGFYDVASKKPLIPKIINEVVVFLDALLRSCISSRLGCHHASYSSFEIGAIM